ncbi:GAS2-like protein 2 [Eublepharis macularius]|uniref:GAS2-like protein 2 n=1 Tax=Eublepharis macularius TaxID=481883 RepID=A0AA97KJ63_EUBMA|nr:GAS2-like protein 2 [Eublepharis macularius]
MSGIQEASMRSIRPYKSSEQYLYAMKEDLAEWLKELYELEIDVGSFLEILETGTVLCHHANNITQVAREFSQEYPSLAHKLQLPTCGVTCNESAQPGTFQARDNVSNFIQWCRKEMDIKEVLMFETEDLVLRKNEKHFVLCLLEVARRASRFGMSAPILIQMEEEIEEEIREDMNLPPEETPLPRPQRQPCNFKNLDQMVQHLVSRCTCPVQFSMIKVSEGKYRVGNSNTLIFVRILRNHVMVRVGGGWDTLEHYLDKHDPCRCTSLSHKQALKTTSLQRAQAAQVQHEITARLMPRTDNPSKTQPTLIVSRSQSPLPPVEWSTYTARSLSTGRKAQSASPPDNSSSIQRTPGFQMSRDHSEPRRVPSARVRERSATPQRLLAPEKKPASKQFAQSGKETLHDRFACQQNGNTNSYASKTLPEPPRGRETKRIQTVALQKAERLPPSVTAPLRDQLCQLPGSVHQEVKCGSPQVRPFSPSKHSQPPTPQASKTQAESSVGLEEEVTGSKRWKKAPLTKRPSSPVKQAHQLPKEDSSTKTSFYRPPTPSKSYHYPRFRNGDNTMPKDLLQSEPSTKEVASTEMGWGKLVSLETSAGKFPDSSRVRICSSNSGQKVNHTRALLREEEAPNSPCQDSKGSRRYPREKDQVYTPLPIDLAEEQALYQSLEEEILSNIKELEADSDGNHHPRENKLKDFATDSGLRKDTLAVGCNGPILSSHTLSNLPNAKKALSYGKDVPRSGVYVPDHNARWPPMGFHYDSVIQELSRTLGRDHLEVERNSPQLSSSLVNGDQAENIVHEEKFVAVESEGNEPSFNTHEGHVEVNRNGNASEPEVMSDKATNSLVSLLEISNLPQNRPRRSLKKPERVPSIYKLKLRPKIRPRKDNRPEKRPSKIPKPVAYRHAQRASSAKTQAKTLSNKYPTQNGLVHVRQNSTGNGGSLEEFTLSQHCPSSSQGRDSGRKTATTKGKMGLTEDEESWV